MASLLWVVTVVLVLAWLLGFAVNLGTWIHILLLLAVVALLVNLVAGAFDSRRS